MAGSIGPILKQLDPSDYELFHSLEKRINDSDGLEFWLSSKAYSDIMTFLLQLNYAMFPKDASSTPLESATVGKLSASVLGLQDLIHKLEEVIEEAPPDTGPRRFGNISFRKWFNIARSRLPSLLPTYLPKKCFNFPPSGVDVPAQAELEEYLLGSFGSPQRLDYGTGHELSFLAFLAGIWKLGGFPNTEPGKEERGIVLGVIKPYLNLIRKLIKIYNLEPAGSHGVWGLDDHFFLPYIFGSAQLSPPLSSSGSIPQQGSGREAPKTEDVAKRAVVGDWREANMYFGAVGFILDVKRGPFWEHSRILYDISGVAGGWAKINKGMIKMYNAEVLSKFPVVQHFHFGGLFKWERDPAAPATHSRVSHQTEEAAIVTASSVPPPGGTKAPWAKPHGVSLPTQTGMPRATVSGTPTPRLGEMNIGPASEKASPNTIPELTVAPWSRQGQKGPTNPELTKEG